MGTEQEAVKAVETSVAKVSWLDIIGNLPSLLMGGFNAIAAIPKLVDQMIFIGNKIDDVVKAADYQKRIDRLEAAVDGLASATTLEERQNAAKGIGASTNR